MTIGLDTISGIKTDVGNQSRENTRENKGDATEEVTRWKKEDCSEVVLEYAIEIYSVELNNAA